MGFDRAKSSVQKSTSSPNQENFFYKNKTESYIQANAPNHGLQEYIIGINFSLYNSEKVKVTKFGKFSNLSVCGLYISRKEQYLKLKFLL